MRLWAYALIGVETSDVCSVCLLGISFNECQTRDWFCQGVGKGVTKTREMIEMVDSCWGSWAKTSTESKFNMNERHAEHPLLLVSSTHIISIHGREYVNNTICARLMCFEPRAPSRPTSLNGYLRVIHFKHLLESSLGAG